MEETMEQRLEKLLKAYSHHYDIQREVAVEGGRVSRRGGVLSAG